MMATLALMLSAFRDDAVCCSQHIERIGKWKSQGVSILVFPAAASLQIPGPAMTHHDWLQLSDSCQTHFQY